MQDQLAMFILRNYNYVLWFLLSPAMIEAYLQKQLWTCSGRDGEVPADQQILWATSDMRKAGIVHDLNPLSNLEPGQSKWVSPLDPSQRKGGLGAMVVVGQAKDHPRLFEIVGRVEERHPVLVMVDMLGFDAIALITNGKAFVPKFSRGTTPLRHHSFYAHVCQYMGKSSTFEQICAALNYDGDSKQVIYDMLANMVRTGEVVRT